MPGICIHEFFWPLRSADGRYYQVCRRCGTQSEYDWTNMQRVDGESERTLGSEESAPQVSAQLVVQPRLNLLVELEPAHRVFFRNLAELLRPAPPGAASFWSMRFWREVIFYSGMPWRRFGQSLLGHVTALAMVLIVSQTWTSPDQPRHRSMFENTRLTYYKPTGSFPALRGNPPRVRPVPRKPAAESARQGSIRVAPERAQAAIQPPDIKLQGTTRPNLLATKLVAPAPPLVSTRLSRWGVSSVPNTAVPTAIVAPPPEISQATSRRPGLPQASGIAPAPQPGTVSSRRVMTVPGSAIIAPPPVVQASIRRVGDVNIGPMVVVAPAPRLPIGEQRTISGAPQSTPGTLMAWAVPPAPSASGSGTLSGGRAGLPSGMGSQVVAPPPSIQDAGSSTAGGHLNPRLGDSLSGAGVQVVPPAPSLEASGNSGAGRASSFSRSASGNTVQAVPPAPSLGAGGNSDHGGRQVAMNTEPALETPAPAVTENTRGETQAAHEPGVHEPGTEEMPLRLIGLAMALPSSTYFSNYEVYIAERRLRKNLTELVKLVYVYLPYQRRLSDYGVDNSKVYKLLVRRDRSCDESLMQITWPEADPHPDLHNSADSPGLSAEDKKNMLPCYRTTADDYRKAVSHR